jgi:inosine-uridine nucleoside N-ribohydrolase
VTNTTSDEGLLIHQAKRVVPVIPAPDQPLRLIVDSDAANEIDDQYAITLAIADPQRFKIEGFVAAQFISKPEQRAGTIERSYQIIQKLLELTGTTAQYPLKRGSPPMESKDRPSKSEGVDLIIAAAHRGSPDNPLWVVGIGASTDLASAMLQDPAIIPNVRYLFHARSPQTWPERSTQFNVKGDVFAAQVLLESGVPLVWFDAGAEITAPMEETEQKLAPLGAIGKYLHEYRLKNPMFQSPKKGFFDLGDIAWLIDSTLATSDIVPAPTMDDRMYFDQNKTHGDMMRVHNLNREKTWELFYQKLTAFLAAK